ncbi:patatin-like phospholipase family protein [Kibdelosporangium lantanae]
MVSRAVVLGAGGHTGFGWQWGVISGLWAAGIRLADADLVVGTSAGAMAAAHLTSGIPPEELWPEVSNPHEPYRDQMLLTQDAFVAELTRMIMAGRSAEQVRTEFGALAAERGGASEEVMRAVVERYVPTDKWPAQRLLIPAVDIGSGEFRVFDQDSGASVVDAVAASCAVPCVWEPVTVGDRRYMDAIVRSPVNADLAAGYERVVVLASIPEIRGVPGASLDEQLAPVRAGGEVLVITPDKPSRDAIGRDQQDLSRRPAAAHAGRDQVAQLLDTVGEHWGD